MITKIGGSSYELIDGLPKGNFSKSWVKFTPGILEGKAAESIAGRDTLLKYIPGQQPTINSFNYPNNEDFEIPLVALNPLVAEIISKTGDPNGQIAEYFLVEQNGELMIASPSFKSSEKELIEGVDILKSEHKKLRRAYVEDVFVMVDDLIEELRRRRVPQEKIEIIIMQFVKDCFKYAYMGLYDPYNTNWGIMYKGIGEAENAPMYDVDLGFNVPVTYKENVTYEYREDFDEYMRRIKDSDYLLDYATALGKKYKWFDSWVDSFVNNLKGIELDRILLEEKGIVAHPNQIQHYTQFMESRNKTIEEYLEKKRQQEI